MYIDTNTIITGAALLAAIISILGALLTAYKWYLKQEKQDTDIKNMKEEQCLLTYGILACLDGLEQLGCNHTVPATKDKIQKHINMQAHDVEQKK